MDNFPTIILQTAQPDILKAIFFRECVTTFFGLMQRPPKGFQEVSVEKFNTHLGM